MSSDCGKVEADVEIKASAAKFHEMFTHKPHHISNVSNSNIQGCDLHEGDWGTVGSVVYWNYFHAKFAEELVEAIDAENNLITFKVIEGDLLEHYKSFKVTIQATPKGEGCNVHWTTEYEKHHDDIEDPHTLLQFAFEVSKDIDAHLTSTEGLRLNYMICD
ncbi:MLP-like protein 28 [Pyrus ussuriensis x Pyrus communis]|uniref:MLP-like protein 28 n=1 Tax=Pyrus ussuriensis x Pyrus communis TaxID=2448454 RepID=A0A5N5H1R8_9ROSA|nr:MLP-like protein 28 [Pyrus ussuriensis x Pyrus communis]